MSLSLVVSVANCFFQEFQKIKGEMNVSENVLEQLSPKEGEFLKLPLFLLELSYLGITYLGKNKKNKKGSLLLGVHPFVMII